jgi:putative redox protein
MATKRTILTAAGDGLRFVGSTTSGHTVGFDDDLGNSSARPAEVLLASLGACTAMDVLSILRRKRQRVSHYRVLVEGNQANEHPHVFTDIRIVHEFSADEVDSAPARRAIELSAGKYCAISATLSSGLTRISHGYVLRRPTPGDDLFKEVLVTGPHGHVTGAVTSA